MNTAELLKILKNRINSFDFLSRHRINKKAFIRKRILTFQSTIAIILNFVRDSTSAELDKFSDYFNVTEPTKSAFSQARHKIKESAFIELNDILIKEYYKSNVKIKSCRRSFFNNLTLAAIDGYNLQLPISSKIKEYFGVATNASDKYMPMSRASELYDIENGLTISALNLPYNFSERDIAIKLIEDFLKKGINKDEFVFIFDRGYPSLLFLVYLSMLGIKFVIRCNTQFLSEVNEAVKTGIKDQEIELPLKKLIKDDRNQLLDRFQEIDFHGTLTIRICLIKLETGGNEILLTSLINKKVFPHKLFKKLYSKRWGVETDIGYQKNRIEIENFSGESVLSVQQEFYGAILWKNVTNMLITECEAELFEVKIESESELIDIDSDEESLEIEVECELIKSEEFHKIKLESKEISMLYPCQIIEKAISYESESECKNFELNQIKIIEFKNLSNGDSKNEISNECLEIFITNDKNQLVKKQFEIIPIELHKQKYDMAINRSIAFSRMKNRFITALFDPDVDMDDFCSSMKKLMKKNIEPIRPGRKYEHKRQYPGKKFHKNSRRVL